MGEKYKCAETQEAKDDYNKKNNNEYQWWRDDDYIVTEDNWKEGCIPLKMERSDKKTVKKWTQDFKKKKVEAERKAAKKIAAEKKAAAKKIAAEKKAAAEKIAAEKKRKLKIETKCANKSSKSSNEFSARQVYQNCLENNNYWKK